MVEGHQCHRVGHFHRQKLLGKRFTCTSPNGRFVDGASAIHNRTLTRIEIHGKNLFYFFEDVVVHIHFGMSGRFALFELGSTKKIPEAKPTTRLEMRGHGLLAHLSAMTVQHGPLSLYSDKVEKLGEDPVRHDACADHAWEKIQNSKKSIGFLLMDQSVIAGVGNIYRAEILFKAGVHPEQPGNTLTREMFDTIWYHSRDLLQRGVKSGSILTVDAEENLPAPWTRRYIYNQSSCGRCGDRIKSWDIASRRAYACPTCQPILHLLSAERQKAISDAQGASTFVSHCAPDDLSVSLLSPEKLTVSQLKTVLSNMKLPSSGKKAVLVDRVTEALAKVKQEAQELVPTPVVPESKKRSRMGTQEDTSTQRVLDLSSIATAREAALEKDAAGEKRNVEHVPLPVDDATNI